jgi:hypothetical protein
MRDQRIVPYVDLLKEFLAGRIDAPSFEHGYSEAFKNETNILPENVFSILDGLFADVDAFCADPELRARTKDGISEEQLRDCCAEALKRLEAVS